MKSKRVQVYRNLHTGTFSVRQDGRVISHPTTLALRDAEFRVQPAGRAKVLIEKRKNVHAYISGYIIRDSAAQDLMSDYKWTYDKRPVRYNPYDADYFMDDCGNRVDACRLVILKPTKPEIIACGLTNPIQYPLPSYAIVT